MPQTPARAPAAGAGTARSTPGAAPAAPAPARLWQVRRWALWGTPASFVCWLLLVVTTAASVTVVAALHEDLRPADVLTCLALVGCGAVCVEAARRTDHPAGIVKDLLSAWTLPAALLLPPLYALVIPLPFAVLLQLRVGRSLLYRRVYSTAAISLATATASVAAHGYYRWAGVGTFTPGHHSAAVLVALGCGLLSAVVNVVLIAVGVRLVTIERTWRELLGDRDQRLLDGAEISIGVAVAGCWSANPVLGLTLLVPVLLVQRSFTHSQLKAAARTDAKTGLLNAAAWQREAEREIVRARRQSQPMAVLLADLDHFKRINDAYGHLVGDRALLGAVHALRDALREYDLLGRFGGEEFTAVLPGADVDEAVRVAARLRQAVANAPLLVDGTLVEVTVSIGVAVLGTHGEDVTDLLAAADHALYQAKSAGRNQVQLAP